MCDLLAGLDSLKIESELSFSDDSLSLICCLNMQTLNAKFLYFFVVECNGSLSSLRCLLLTDLNSPLELCRSNFESMSVLGLHRSDLCGVLTCCMCILGLHLGRTRHENGKNLTDLTLHVTTLCLGISTGTLESLAQ